MKLDSNNRSRFFFKRWYMIPIPQLSFRNRIMSNDVCFNLRSVLQFLRIILLFFLLITKMSYFCFCPQESYGDDQNTRGLFREEAFVLSKRDKPTPDSVARLARMHSTVGIGKRDAHGKALHNIPHTLFFFFLGGGGCDIFL